MRLQNQSGSEQKTNTQEAKVSYGDNDSSVTRPHNRQAAG